MTAAVLFGRDTGIEEMVAIGAVFVFDIVGIVANRVAFADQTGDALDAEGRGYPDVGTKTTELSRTGIKHLLEGTRLLGMAVAESPEIQARQRAKARSDARA